MRNSNFSGALLAAALMVSAGCASGGAAPPEDVERGQEITPNPPVYALIGDRERLELEANQIDALDSIGQWLSASNDSIRTALPREASRNSDEISAAIEALNANNAQAMAGIEALLSEQQKEQVCESAAESAADRRDRRREAQNQSRNRRGAAPRRTRSRRMELVCATRLGRGGYAQRSAARWCTRTGRRRRTMNARGIALAAVVLIGACATGNAPREIDMGVSMTTSTDPPPVVGLIGHRRTLDLSDEQVAALDSIGRWIAAENDAALAELKDNGVLLDGRAITRGGRRAAREVAEINGLLRQVRVNNLQAARGVGTLLDEDQKQEACELFRAPQREPVRGGPGGTPRFRAAGEECAVSGEA